MQNGDFFPNFISVSLPQVYRRVKMPSFTLAAFRLIPSPTRERPSSFNSQSNTNRRLTVVEAMQRWVGFDVSFEGRGLTIFFDADGA